MRSTIEAPILSPKPRDAFRVARWVMDDGSARGFLFRTKSFLGFTTISNIVFSAYGYTHDSMRRKLNLTNEAVFSDYIIKPSGNVFIYDMETTENMKQVDFMDNQFFIEVAQHLGNNAPKMGKVEY